MVSDDLTKRLLVVTHIQNPDWQLKVDLICRQRQNEAFDIRWQRLEMCPFDSHVAQRIDLRLNRFLEAETKLEDAILRRVSVLTLGLSANVQLSLNKDWMVWLQIVKSYLDDAELWIILPILVFDRDPKEATNVAYFLRIMQ